MKNAPATTEPTLYRKYRPQTFGDVAGQEHVVRVLSRALELGRVAHAYLFSGPRGTGKTTIARLLAKRLNCEQPTGVEPCGRCGSCRAVAQGAHLDLIEIDAASNRGIDDIRLLKERISLAPTHGHWKVYIVDEVHMLSKDAFNALLKTLEEPPAHAVFILATTELEKVPDTVRSRCQTFIFRRAPVSLLMERLSTIARAEKFSLSEDALRIVANLSGGCFRDAESLLSMLVGIGEKEMSAEDVTRILGLAPTASVQDFVDALFARDAQQALARIRHVTDSGNSLSEFTTSLARYLRALATWAVSRVHAESFSPQEEERLQQQAQARPLSEIVALVRSALRAKYELRDALYEELPVELLALEWCGKKEGNREQGTENRDTTAANAPAERAPVVETAQPKAQAKTETVASAKPSPLSAFSYQLVVERWPEFLRRASLLHPLLRPMFGSALPLAVRDGSFFLWSDNVLLHERCKDSVFRQKVEECLDDAFETKLRLRLVRERDLAAFDLPRPSPEIRAEFAAALSESSPVAEPALADTLTILGGEVVGETP